MALSGGAAGDCHRAPSVWGLKETRQGAQEAEESAAPWESKNSSFPFGLNRYRWAMCVC